MDSGLLLAVLSTLSCVALGLAVAARRERSGITSTALALLLATAVWASALGFARWRGADPWAVVAVRVAALAEYSAAALWLLLALRQRWPLRLASPVAAVCALAPAACIAAGAALFADAAVRMWREHGRRPALAVLLVMSVQPVLAWRDLRVGVADADPLAAGALTLAILVLAMTLLRYSLLLAPLLGHRQVIEQLRHGVLMANAAGEILDHNAAAQRLLGGHPRGRRIADAIATLVLSEQREPIRDAIDRTGDTLEPIFLQIETDRRAFEVSVRPISGDRGSPLGQVATIRDRTAERSYAEAALRTQKLEAVGTLAAGVAHEVDSPLAFVRANLDEIARLAELTHAWRTKHESPLADALAEMGELAHDALAGLARIQRAVSDVRRLAAAPDGGTRDVSLEAVVLDAVRMLELRASGRVEIRTHLAPGLPEVHGSAQLLVQAVLGLLIHSRQALEGMPEPWIEVETGASGDGGAWVRVRDNGPDLLAARDTAGCALGTSLAAGIARDHGGSLIAEPCEDGASFVLRLPARGDLP